MVAIFDWRSVPADAEGNEHRKEPDVIDKAAHEGPTIYVVVEGEYSDKEVVAVYDEAHKENAFQLAESSNGFIVKLSCNAEADRLQRGLRPYHVAMWRDGNTSTVYTVGLVELGYGNALGTVTKIEGAKRTHCRQLHWYGWAIDDTHAIRCADDVRIRMLSAHEWEEDAEEKIQRC